MTPEHARVMARYNRWMNDELYAVAETIGDTERKKDRGAMQAGHNPGVTDLIAMLRT